ncbi:MAG: S1 RNA-binding domain-containing protein [Chloroflexi bacterium]|nr:S1 RNA-binding domain-containing protein [Chloroflexota bacterium]
MTGDPQIQQSDVQQGDAEDDADQTTDMATLLEESAEFRSPQRGEVVEGVVMGWDRDGALIDIASKTEGVVPKHEMRSLGSEAEEKLQPGEKVLVYIVQPETPDGQILLSIDRARGERGWLTLQERFESGESFDGEVSGYNKGGLLVNVEGVNAFVPLSQVVGVRPDRNREDGGSSSLAEAVGRKLRLKVIEINRRRNRVILSERAALQEWRMEQKERLIAELHEGDIRKGRVSSVRNFGVFIDLGGADGLAHLSELSWERDKSPSELFKVGDEVDVYITKVDAENKRIALSPRRANPAKWDAVVDKYQEGQVITGLVTKLVTFGAFARIEGPVEGLIHVSELVDRRIGHPKEVTREGDLLPLKIVRIERDRHRLGLSLRRARDEGEALGFVFSEGGEVLSVPDEVRDEFIERAGPIPDLQPEAAATEEPDAEAPAEEPEAAASEEPAAEAPAEEPEEEEQKQEA